VQKLVIQWGTVSETRVRSAAECVQDYRDLKAFLVGPEFAKVWQGILITASIAEERLAKETMARIQTAYTATPQVPPVSALTAVRVRAEPLQRWQQRLPVTMRDNLVVIVADFRDPQQVAWMIRQLEAYPMAQAFAVGWERYSDIGVAIDAFPLLANVQSIREQGEEAGGSLAYERWFAGWGIRALPARIRFLEDSTEITEGLSP